MKMDSNYIQLRPGRQLFIDDFLINNTDLKRVYTPPTPSPNNPVLEPTENWEMTTEGALYAGPFSDGVWYDEIDGVFKMWYMAGGGKYYPNLKNALYTCYAESHDGIKWTKKPQGILDNTNVIDVTLRDAASIWIDKVESDPEKRYKMFLVNRRDGGKDSRLLLKYSSDGIHWSKPAAKSGKVRDRISAYFDPFSGQWVVSMRYETPSLGKTRSYAMDKDPERLVNSINDGLDDKISFWFGTDGTEPRHPRFPEINPGIYNFDVIAYESILLGYYTIWQGPSNEKASELNIHKRNEVFLGYSRDGINFKRISNKPFFEVNESEGAWNWGNVQSTNGSPIIVRDELFFYNTGRRLNKTMWDSYMSVGVGKLRRDGFAALRGDRNGGTVCTKALECDGSYLFVNANVSKGSLEAELLGENFNVIQGFSRLQCIGMLEKDKTKWLIKWKGKATLSGLIKKIVRIKFYVQEGELYSFWFSPYQTGESMGFTAGGGPNLHSSGIDVPE